MHLSLSLITVGLLFSNAGFGKDPMCVRNYAKQGAGEICTSHSENYASVEHLQEKTIHVCTRIYDNFYCETAKEYEYVTSLDGKKFCTLNYNQPPVGNYCDSVAQFYDYIKKNPTE